MVNKCNFLRLGREERVAGVMRDWASEQGDTLTLICFLPTALARMVMCALRVRALSPLGWGGAEEGCTDLREERVVFSPQSRGPESSRGLGEAQSQQGKSVGLQAPLREWTAAQCPSRLMSTWGFTTRPGLVQILSS